MTQEQKRIKIAEAVGFRFNGQSRSPDCPQWGEPTPDYFNDLNAMHEARAARLVSQSDVMAFEARLARICGSLENAIHATAAQRAEAFGLTLGLWKEGE